MPRKKREEEPCKDPFTPREIGRIIKEFLGEVRRLNRQGGQYNGWKMGQQFELRYNPVKKDVWWRVCIDRHWTEGSANDVFHALNALGGKIANKALDRRLDRLAEEAGATA